MNKPNFNEMSRKELRRYVLMHRDDEEAFRALVDRFQANLQQPISSDEALDEMQRRLAGKEEILKLKQRIMFAVDDLPESLLPVALEYLEQLKNEID